MSSRINTLRFIDGVTVTEPSIEGNSGSSFLAGPVNYVTSPNDADGWSSSGGGITVSTTVVESEIPRFPARDRALKIEFLSGSIGAYVSHRFQVGPVDRNRLFYIKWAMQNQTYINGATVEVYANDSADYSGQYSQLSVNDGDVLNTEPHFKANFETDHHTYYELRIVNLSETGSHLYLNDVFVEPTDNLGIQIATDTGYGLVQLNRIQTKKLDGNLQSSTTDIPSLRLHNLNVGERYRLTMQVFYFCYLPGIWHNTLRAIHNGTSLLECQVSGQMEANDAAMLSAVKANFIATAKTITFDFIESGVASALIGDLNEARETEVTIERLNTYEQAYNY